MSKGDIFLDREFVLSSFMFWSMLLTDFSRVEVGKEKFWSRVNKKFVGTLPYKFKSSIPMTVNHIKETFQLFPQILVKIWFIVFGESLNVIFRPGRKHGTLRDLGNNGTHQNFANHNP